MKFSADNIRPLLTRGAVIIAALGAAAIFLVWSEAKADQLVYQPVNPAFGGNPLNSSFLLSTAEAHRPKKPASKKSPLDTFTESIQSSLLNRISQKIADAILGEGGQDKGSFDVGGTHIDYEKHDGKVTIHVTDASGSTTLELPVSDLLSSRAR